MERWDFAIVEDCSTPGSAPTAAGGGALLGRAEVSLFRTHQSGPDGSSYLL